MTKELIIILIILTISFLLFQSVGLLYKKVFESHKQIHLKFFKNLVQALIVVVGLYSIGMQFDVFKEFSSTLLLSSSLLVAVLGFAFQSSLEDFIAGVMLSLFRPFNIGERISLIGLNISGYIEDITIRHTVIRTFNNSRLMIPNSVINKEIIENTHIVDTTSSGFMDVTITYKSDLKKAKRLMSQIIAEDPDVIDERTQEEREKGIPQVQVFVRELGENGIALRASVITKDIDINFQACSNIRAKIVEIFEKEGIELAYPHMTVDMEKDRGKS